jgi:hypothetical protein
MASGAAVSWEGVRPCRGSGYAADEPVIDTEGAFASRGRRSLTEKTLRR